LLLCAAVLAATVLYPTARMAIDALAIWDTSAITTGRGLAAARNTFLMALASVACAGLLGTGLALALNRYTFPGRALLAALAYLPLTLPPLVGVLSFYYIIGRDGFLLRALSSLLGTPVELPGALAILLIHTYSFFVFFYATVSAALEGFDRSLLEAGRTLGATPLRVFTRVTLPLLRPALAAAALLTFMTSMASFSAPFFFGGDFPMLSVEIFNARSNYENTRALTLTLVLGAVSLVGLFLFRERAARSTSATKGVRTPLRGQARLWAGVAAWGGIALLLLPHLTILAFALADHRAWQSEVLPTRYTLANFTAIFTSSGAFAPIKNSLWTSALGTIAALAIALPAAYLMGRKRPGSRIITLLVMLPWALPGTVLAMNLITAFNSDWLPLYNTVWLLPIAYFVRSVPLVARMLTAAIGPFDATLIEAARTLGATPAYTFRHIVLPLLMPALAAATALAFATNLGEFVASILIYVPRNVPISVWINTEWRSGAGPAFAYSVLLMLLAGATFTLSRRFSTRAL